MHVNVAGPERIVRLLVEPPTPVFLLGAGASASSGVPLAESIVDKAGRWAYALDNGRHPDDPHIQRSDWYRWLASHEWFVEGDPATNYPRVVEHLLRPRKKRAEFFRERILNTGVPPNIGYRRIADLMDRRAIHTVLTTNFDRLVEDAATLVGRPHHIESVRVPSDYVRFSTAAEYPQLVFLHGSVEHYTDQNQLEEVQRLDDDLVELLKPLLRDRPLVVIGYRGAEPSVMKHLLMDNVSTAGGYRHGIYWCTTDAGPAKAFNLDGLHPLVRELARKIDSNFSAVPIEDFDTLLDGTIWPRFQASGPAHTATAQRPRLQSVPPTSDMRVITESGIEEIDLALARARVIQYCDALDIRIPSAPTDEWVLRQMEDRNLVRREGQQIVPTLAGLLLFGQKPQRFIPSARTCIRFVGASTWLQKVLAGEAEEEDLASASHLTIERIVEGTLWNQLDRVNDALALVNLPFRLKGAVSETVYPYPSLLLKELVVNALVHRDFDSDEPVTVEITPSFIHISNPGGLVDEVRQQVDADSIEEEIRSGHRGIKGCQRADKTGQYGAL